MWPLPPIHKSSAGRGRQAGQSRAQRPGGRGLRRARRQLENKRARRSEPRGLLVSLRRWQRPPRSTGAFSSGAPPSPDAPFAGRGGRGAARGPSGSLQAPATERSLPSRSRAPTKRVTSSPPVPSPARRPCAPPPAAPPAPLGPAPHLPRARSSSHCSLPTPKRSRPLTSNLRPALLASSVAPSPPSWSHCCRFTAADGRPRKKEGRDAVARIRLPSPFPGTVLGPSEHPAPHPAPQRPNGAQDTHALRLCPSHQSPRDGMGDGVALGREALLVPDWKETVALAVFTAKRVVDVGWLQAASMPV
ncbi:serine/arginine repetitive matrix protein 1-like [Pongo pygmaeus]|uniref:serine/arginine repetitive matrix protein 1-like n=1 Tax=Pongo pygmaeus TaxID=9600 RepID=UPI0023E1A50B|nr:serine/arginine repetitive matrix protein 1-like [Pongo pygmaeus]